MDDWRLAVGCGNGTVQLVDLRRPASSAAGTGSSSEAGGQGTAPSKLQARTVLPAHRERVSLAAFVAEHGYSCSRLNDICGAECKLHVCCHHACLCW